MLYLLQGNENLATILYREKDAKQSGQQYLKIEVLPEGSGILRTDLKTVWWEEPEPEPKREVYIPVETKVKAQQDRIDFLEDCIAEMAQIVYN